MTADDRQARSFGQAADAYDAIRPSYPREAIEWALGTEPLEVVDLGAGTGILSRLLAAVGHRVTAVDPDHKMLAALRAKSAGVADARPGDAEHIPLPDASADAVTAGQAYHWFDPGHAHPEIARVLRPGGVFVPIWNIRDSSVPWVAEMSEYIGTSKAERTVRQLEGSHFPPYFEPTERFETRYTRPFDEDALVELVKSRSYYLTGDDAHRAELERRARDLVHTHPDLAGRDTFELPYVTVAYRLRHNG
ncbi:class I SAM-dependent methyltransferase [Phytomonospora sp. NPDC050363]|uniref:class I SAM-dependent methyltransferase n=1 Tax=Phytomonospora sp. NPDC050363 TaxID=3155642 RepID=UPI0033EA943C